MLNLKQKNLLRSLVHSQERKKYYSTNTNRITNTYKCSEHNDYFSKICLKCNTDICQRCEKQYHYNHNIVKYEEIIPDYFEIENLQKRIKTYVDIIDNLKKEITAWYTELKNKIYDFELSLKNNDIYNSFDFITNYSKYIICFNSIYKFRKIYYNIMEENNAKNKKIMSLINQYRNNNLSLPTYYNYFEIKYLLLNLTHLNTNFYKKESSMSFLNNSNKDIQEELNYSKEIFSKKTELILNYLLKIPYIENNSSSINFNNNEVLSKCSSFYTLPKNPFLFSNEQKNTDFICDKSTGYKNSNENYKTYSEKRIIDSKVNEFKNILNRTKIPEFNLGSKNKSDKSDKLNKTFNLGEKKNYNITDFTKYLNKMGLLNMNENDLHNMNSSQDLLNKSSYSIKSTKYVQNRNNSYNFTDKKYNNNLLEIKSNLYDSIKKENKENKVDNENIKKIQNFNNGLYTNKNIQTKTYVHKKFNNNINKINDKNKKNNIIKFQKKIIIINKSNKKNNIQQIKIREDNKENQKNIENKHINFENNIYNNNNEIKDNNKNILEQKIIRTKEENENLLNNDNDDDKKEEKLYSSPIRPELLKNAIISDAKKKIVNDYDNDNEESNINTTDKKDLLNIIYSPSNNIKQSTNKKNDMNKNKNSDYKTYKITNSINLNLNPPNIIKTHKNIPFFVDPEKEICIGLELGNSECKIGIVNQNTGEIQLVCFDENKYSIPTLISFGQNKKEIKIGHKADEDIYNNPSQTIFNIIKFFGQKYNDIKGKNDLWPFKVYFTNDEENRPYLKINFGPQKDKIFYFENILSIFLQKMFEFVFNKVKLENNSNYNTKEKIKGEDNEDLNKNIIILNTILVLTIPNYFSYYQRQLIEKIIKTEIFPEINNINNENIKIYGKYKINLLGIKIENASSIASVCLNSNYDLNNPINKNKNILILNLDGGSANVSITSSKNENEKQIYEVKAINSLAKGGTDLFDDFMYEILKKFEDKIKKDILDSPLALVKLRKLCEKIRLNLIQKENYTFNIVEIMENYDSFIEVYRQDYENASFNLYNNIKLLIYDTLNDAKLKEKDINDIIFIGELCREKRLEQIIEQLFRQDNRLYEELIYSNYMDNEKDFYIVGGAAYHALNYINSNKYYFNDISAFSIGVQTYTGVLSYIITKGEKIPIKNQKVIKLDNENELKIYEKYDEENKNIKLIETIEINNDNFENENYIKYGYREVKIEYEINEDHQLFISLFNGDKIEKKIKL